MKYSYQEDRIDRSEFGISGLVVFAKKLKIYMNQISILSHAKETTFCQEVKRVE